jgi:hypothetical protein
MTTTAPSTAHPHPRIPATRIAADTATVAGQLGLLGNLAGTWEGSGFNLITRPDFHDSANLYLQLNQTRETLAITPIGSPIPNRGFGQDDIELFGLNYLQRIEDAATGGALHFEPGLWVTQPPTSYPQETAQPGEQIIFRLGSIPHGNSLLIQGTASAFTGPPAVKTGTAEYAFSAFPSFNSTPFAASPVVINAVGSSEKETATVNGVGPGFQEYDLTAASDLANPRTPFDTDPPDPPLPASINGVAMQDVVNDPASLLQAVINQQVAAGDTFSGVALNIATQSQITFFDKPNSKAGDPNSPTTTVALTDAGGSIGNIPFLDGGIPAGAEGPNAETALVYATFWIEKVTPPNGAALMQLQYAQFTQLDFPIFTALHPPTGNGAVVNLGWPHVSVATLRKTFG